MCEYVHIRHFALCFLLGVLCGIALCYHIVSAGSDSGSRYIAALKAWYGCNIRYRRELQHWAYAWDLAQSLQISDVMHKWTGSALSLGL